jgi:Na+-transporting NADH:ubiquinone oxidoreductase subunit C
MQRDSILNTLVIAVSVCLICSLLVASAAVGLREKQKLNVELDRKKNILQAAGFSDVQMKQAGGVLAFFDQRVKPIIVNLESGSEGGLQEIVAADPKDDWNEEASALKLYDQITAAKKPIPGLFTEFQDTRTDVAGISRKEKYSHVYLVQSEDGQVVEKYVFPIRGKGLWSILKGFIAVENDFQTISGLTFYEHAETPGLGGEVDNAKWKQQWVGKAIYDEDGEVGIEVIKGVADAGDQFAVDGLSGATITSRGVTNMLKFWLGPSGFGPFIKNQSASGRVSLGSSKGAR